MAQFKIKVGDASYGLNMPEDATSEQISAAADDFVHTKLQGAAPDAPQPAPAQPQASPTPDTSLAGAAMHGLHGAAAGMGSTMKVAGDAIGSPGLSSAGSAVAGAIGDAKGYQPTDIAGALRSGDLGSAVRQLPRAAVEGGTDLLGGLGSAAVGGAVGGPIGAAAGAGTYAAARNFGQNAEAAAQDNHNAPTDNLARAGIVTAGQAALNTVGLGKLPGVASAVSSMPSAIVRSAARVGLDGAAAAGSDALGQVGNSIGTAEGVKFDPAQSAAAGLQGAAARAVGEAVPLTQSVGKEAVERGMAAASDKPVTLDQARSWSQVRDDYQSAMDRATAAKGDTSPLAVMNSVKKEYANTAAELTRALRDKGFITPEQARGVRDVFDQAQRSNNTPTENGGDVTTLFDRIKDLNIGEDGQKTLEQLARAMDTASGESFAKNQTGPLRKIGGVLGNVAGIGGSLATGNVPAIVGSVLDTALGRGHGISGKIGEAVGGAGDRFLGTNQPSLLYKARSADAMLSRAGEDAGGSPLEAAQNMRGSIQDASDAIQSAKTRQTMETLKQQQLDAMQKQAADQQAQQQSSADSAFKPAEKDQAASEKQRQAQIDAYLNQPAEAPASTSSEIAGWQQILANHATKAADAARARAVLERANNGSIDSMAQAKIDKSGKSNEVQLRASELQPGYPGTGDTAGTAAAVQQAMAAQRLRGLAAANPEAGDRLSVGLPAFDPTPAAGLSPPGPRPAPGATQATSQPSPVQPQQETPQGAPAAPQIAPVLSVPGMMAKPTLHAYAERGIGRSVSDAEFQQHMAALTSSGAYPPDIAAQLTTHTGGIDNLKAVAEPLKASLSASSARKAAVGIPSDPLPGEKGEPRSPTQYASGERNYVRLADGMTQDAKDAGHHELATVIRQIAAEPATSEKAKIRAEALHSLPEGERAAARRALTGRLMVGRDDMPSAAEAVKSHLKRNGSK